MERKQPAPLPSPNRKPRRGAAVSRSAAQPPQPHAGDSEARYQRRAAFLGNPRAKWGLAFAGLVLLVAVFFLWRYFEQLRSNRRCAD